MGMCCTIFSVVAQNASPYWSVSGNSNATTASKLGTTNSIPLRLVTNNIERLHIDVTGKVGIGITAPKGQLTIQSSGSAPAASWVTSGVPLLSGFGENTPGNADNILAMASNTASARAVFLGRKSRGTLAAPAVVQNNDYLLSLYSSGYDGGTFQAPASVDFLVDGTVTSGHVPTRISLSTGSGFADRVERLKVGSTGDFNFNNGQLFMQEATGNVGIGTVAPAVKLDVRTPYGTAVFGQGSVGVEGVGIGSGAYGLYGHSAGTYSYGLVGIGSYAGVYTIGTNYGIYSSSAGYAGYFSGTVFSSAAYTGSDAKLKEHVTGFDSALAIIGKLKPRIYQFRQDGLYKEMHLPDGQHYGLIAQDLEAVLPGLIKATRFEPALDPAEMAKHQPDSKPAPAIDFKAVNYTELIPIVVKGMQEQQDQIQQLVEHIKQQDSTIRHLTQQLSELTGAANVSEPAGMLSQNSPNPAGQLTSVSYKVPSAARQAYIAVVDNAGRLLQNISVVGSGTVRINTAGLAGGVYHYSLIADNRVIATKQLLIAR